MASSPNETREFTYWLINIFTTILSILGSIWTTYFCLKLRSSQNYSMKLILAITIADFVYSIINFISIFENNTWDKACAVQSLLREWSLQMTLFFSTCLALLCYKCAKYGSRYDQALFFRKCVIIGIFIYLWLNGVFYLTDELTWTRESYCHLIINKDITSEAIKKFVSLVYFGLPIIVELVVIIVTYFLLDREIRSSLKESTLEMDDSGVSLKKLLWYPAIQFITFATRFLDSLTKAYFGEDSTFYFVVKIIHILSTHSIGFTNAVLYGIQMKQYYRKMYIESSNHRLSVLGDSTLYDDEDGPEYQKSKN